MKHTGLFRLGIMAVLALLMASGTSFAAAIDLTEDGGFAADGTVAYASTTSVTLYEDEGMGYTVLYNDPYCDDGPGISAEGETLSFDISIYTTGYDSFEINLLTSAEDPISLYYYESSGLETIDFDTSCSFSLADYDLDGLFGLEFVLTSVAYDDITDTADAQFTISNVQTTSAVPLPTSFVLLGTGLVWLTRRQRKTMR